MELIALVCCVCKGKFSRPKNLAVKSRICTPANSKHPVRFEHRPDGTIRKITCSCCSCIYKRTMGKHGSLDGKLIPSARVSEFLRKTALVHGEPVSLAFRVGINAMLRVSELAGLKKADILAHAKPLPQLQVVALKKKMEMIEKVDLDPATAGALSSLARSGAPGDSMFGMPVRTLQHKFKTVARDLGLGHLSIHSLRHTGISLRARKCRTMDELNYVRQQARHESIETTRVYMGFEENQRKDMAKRINWA